MIELRLRTKVSPAELEQKIGKIVTDSDYNVLLHRAAKILKPDGKPLCIYLPGVLNEQIDFAYPTLQKIRMKSDNRGLASGTKRVNAGGTRTRAMPVISAVLGAMDPSPRVPVCRLTSYTREHTDAWKEVQPLLRRMAHYFQEYVPDRFHNQQKQAGKTKAEWVVPGTPFTTITVNNSYSTGVHTDKGDLDAGFSCLAVGRRGGWTGGRICFPEYRVAADLRNGDLLLMDAHEWHGNTAMRCACGEKMAEGPCTVCGSERISLVAYYRTKMISCDTPTAEEQKRNAQVESRARMTSAAS